MFLTLPPVLRLGAVEAPAASPNGSGDNIAAYDDAQFAGMTDAERVKAKAKLLLDMRCVEGDVARVHVIPHLALNLVFIDRILDAAQPP